MPNEKADWSALEQYLPPNAFTFINHLLIEHTLKIIVSKPRKRVLGYYKPPQYSDPRHIITINGNLSHYAFFIVLIHEIAHLKTFVTYGNRVAGHGMEWKKIYSNLLLQSLQLNCYPTDLQEIIQQKANNFSILRSCTDDDLLRVLKKYDTNPQHAHLKTIEEIGIGSHFIYKNNKFIIKKKRRTRYLCENLDTRQDFLFHSLTEVEQ